LNVPIDADRRTGRITYVEILALRGAEVLQAVLALSIESGLAAFPQPDVRLTIHDLGFRGERELAGGFEGFRHPRNLFEKACTGRPLLRSGLARFFVTTLLTQLLVLLEWY
jgi:hypothetical protein